MGKIKYKLEKELEKDKMFIISSMIPTICYGCKKIYYRKLLQLLINGYFIQSEIKNKNCYKCKSLLDSPYMNKGGLNEYNKI
jgi:hypothetical protein